MIVPKSLALTALVASVNGYWLMGIEDFITTERIDPVVNPGEVSTHVHSVLGGSNFRMSVNTASLRQSTCTSIPIPQDKSAYWFPHLYFHWANGSVTSAEGGAVIYYLFSDKPGTTTAFPDDFRMISGTAALRTYDPKSYAQLAVTFLCLNFGGVSTRHNELPAKTCPNGIRAQINFPSCWDGKNTDSTDHKSHVAFPSGGPDSGTCSDPKFPVTIPRIFLEVYWGTPDFDKARPNAMNPSQPFVFAHGDPTGYGYHADFVNGWEKGVLQRAVDNCHCNPYGDPTCCVDQGIFSMNHDKTCRITKAIDEQTTGTLPKLPGNNPIIGQGVAIPQQDNVTPALIAPVYAYEGDKPTTTGKVVTSATTSKPLASAATATSVTTSSTATITSATTTTPPAPATKPVNAASTTGKAVASATQTTPSKSYHLVDRSSSRDSVAREPELDSREGGTDSLEVDEDAPLHRSSKHSKASCPSTSTHGPSQKERLVKVRRGVHHHHHRHAFSHQNAAHGL